jgi:hypothetical protein
MSKNMNILDRRRRAPLVAHAAIVIGILIGPGSAGATILYTIATIMVATSAAGYCPLYSLLHLDAPNRGPLAR